MMRSLSFIESGKALREGAKCSVKASEENLRFLTTKLGIAQRDAPPTVVAETLRTVDKMRDSAS